jgi:beta-glucanase (GH16 family)
MPKHLPYSITLLSLLGCVTPGKVAEQDPVDTNVQESRDTSTDTETDTGNEQAEDDTANEETGDTGTEEPVDPPNLLLNPSFEDGEEHWNIWGGASRVEGNAQDGNWAVQASSGNGSEQYVTGLRPNTTYRLSGWGKVEGELSMGIGAKNYGGPQKMVNFTTSEYTEGSVTFSTGLSNTSAVIFAYKHSGDTLGFADNLELVEVEEADRVLLWSDEFDIDGSVDSSKWQFEEGFVRNEELQWYQEDNAVQENGYLVIEGRAEQRPNPNYDPTSSNWRLNRENIEYTSSSINTDGKFEWQYGRMVVRAKVTNLQGTWPAIWTLGTECDWPSSGEIDVMENYGGKILGNFAWGSNQPWTPVWDVESWNVADLPEGWTDEFHLWELVRTEQNMTIYVDGMEINSVDLSTTINGSANCAGENPFQQPHYILLNLALGGGAGGSVENLSFPTQYLIDYVRVYE